MTAPVASSDGPTAINRHWYRGGLPADAIYVGRGTPLGNPFTVAEFGMAALDMYRRWLFRKITDKDPAVLAAMRQIGPRSLLACSCKPMPCHADVIVKAWRWMKSEGML